MEPSAASLLGNLRQITALSSASLPEEGLVPITLKGPGHGLPRLELHPRGFSTQGSGTVRGRDSPSLGGRGEQGSAECSLV